MFEKRIMCRSNEVILIKVFKCVHATHLENSAGNDETSPDLKMTCSVL